MSYQGFYVLTFIGISLGQAKQNKRETKTNNEVFLVDVNVLVPLMSGSS